MTRDNEDRAETAHYAIDEYCQANPDYMPGIEIDDEVLTDLLADLRHFCNINGHDFDSCLSMSETNFEQEA